MEQTVNTDEKPNCVTNNEHKAKRARVDEEEKAYRFYVLAINLDARNDIDYMKNAADRDPTKTTVYLALNGFYV
jgi:hypothetical protein